MWIFTRYGFFSIVCARRADGSHGQPPDPDRLMVRARHRGQLERLCRRFPEALKLTDIVASSDTDYPVRIFVAKRDWVAVVEALTREIDYDNFKSEVGRSLAAEPDAQPYLHCLHGVWSEMRNLESSG